MAGNSLPFLVNFFLVVMDLFLPGLPQLLHYRGVMALVGCQGHRCRPFPHLTLLRFDLIPKENSFTDRASERVITRVGVKDSLLDLSKTKEIIFHRPSPRLFSLPDPINDIKRIKLVKLLILHFRDDLRNR